MAPPKADEVNNQTTYRGREVPALGLVADLDLPFRVYVLACAPSTGQSHRTFYVGIEYIAWVGRRIQAHFNGDGADFTKKHKPSEVILIWPAANRVVEAYVFFAMQAIMPRGSCHRLAGWTQTSSAPSPLACLILEQSRRNLTNKCFRCGGDHWASRCKKEEEACTYRCLGCSAAVRITSRGQSLPAPASAEAAVAASSSFSSSSSPSSSSSTSAGRSTGEPSNKRPRLTSSGFLRVKVCGQDYSTIAWYLKNANPGPRACERVKESCAEKAVELKGGDSKSLAASGFAKSPPGRAKELLPGRERLPSIWTATACKSIKTDEALQLRKIVCATGCRNVLWSVSDLESVL